MVVSSLLLGLVSLLGRGHCFCCFIVGAISLFGPVSLLGRGHYWCSFIVGAGQ